MEIVLILVLALILDISLGDPPNFLHPVAWMGHIIAFFIKLGKGLSPRTQFVIGLAVSLFTIALFTAAAFFLLYYLRQLNIWAYIIAGALIFKTTFTLRGLYSAARKIRDLLKREKLDQARFELRALVGRDTRKLDKSHMISATVESVAENICDSFFAPLFYFAFLGVPGAIGYRVINTLDAMIGHHGEYEYLGKFAARLDTVANFIPARLAALIMIPAAWIVRAKSRNAWRILRRDSGKTESPNAGWTMSVVAGALEVELEKMGYYKLGDSRNPLTLKSINLSLDIVFFAAGIWTLLIFIGEVVFHVATQI